MSIKDKDDKSDSQVYSMIQCAYLSCMHRKAKDKEIRDFLLTSNKCQSKYHCNSPHVDRQTRTPRDRMRVSEVSSPSYSILGTESSTCSKWQSQYHFKMSVIIIIIK